MSVAVIMELPENFSIFSGSSMGIYMYTIRNSSYNS